MFPVLTDTASTTVVWIDILFVMLRLSWLPPTLEVAVHIATAENAFCVD